MGSNSDDMLKKRFWYSTYLSGKLIWLRQFCVSRWLSSWQTVAFCGNSVVLLFVEFVVYRCYSVECVDVFWGGDTLYIGMQFALCLGGSCSGDFSGVSLTLVNS